MIDEDFEFFKDKLILEILEGGGVCVPGKNLCKLNVRIGVRTRIEKAYSKNNVLNNVASVFFKSVKWNVMDQILLEKTVQR